MLLSQASAWNATPTKATKTGANKRIAVMRELLQQQSTAPIMPFTPAPFTNFQGTQRMIEPEADAYPVNRSTGQTHRMPGVLELNEGMTTEPTVIPKPMIEPVSITDDGSGLADFNPVNKPATPTTTTVMLPVPSVQAPQQIYEGFSHKQPMQSQHPISAYNKSMGVEYNRAYSPPEYDWLSSSSLLPQQQPQQQPQHQQQYRYGQRQQPTPQPDLQQISLDEKLSRILFLLEESRMEQTQYVGEEIALYTLLGAFVIGVLDSFVHLGKYVR